jgi:lipooligosaccharide transport system ATP-binding protein
VSGLPGGARPAVRLKPVLAGAPIPRYEIIAVKEDTHTPDGAVIVCRGLTKRYGELTAVDGVDLEVGAGECVGFLGPNGAGKTTLMRMIFSAVARSSGKLSVFGLEPMRDRKRINARIGVVFQDNNLDEELDVVNNLMIYARYCGLDSRTAREQCDALLELMSLSARRRSKVRELSGGMMRRLMVARALLNRPRLLILDEPTTGLDPQVRHSIWAALRQLKREGLTLLLTTHYMEEAQALADRVMIMDGGRVILGGAPSALIEEHMERFVLQASGQGGAPAAVDGIRHEQVGDADYFYSPEEEPLRRLSESLPLENVVLRYANLEDVFLKFTGRGLKE